MSRTISRTISNSDDIIDSREVIARIEELQDERTTLKERIAEETTSDDADEALIASAMDELTVWDEDSGDELKALLALQDEADGASDWVHGEALIRDSYFEDYARQLADDMGAIDGNANWPMNCIDWEEAASLLQQDYTSVDFDGVTYWIRS